MFSVASSIRVVLMIGIAAGQVGCGIPHDPHRTFERARRSVVRVGYTANPPWVSVANGNENAEPAGIEPRLLEDFSGRIGSRVEWRNGSETELIEALERGELDVLIGGFKDSAPWSSKAGMTRPFARVNDDRHVMLLRLGENRWLLELDRFLEPRKADVERQAQAAAATTVHDRTAPEPAP